MYRKLVKECIDMNMKPEISIIIPAYNEAKRISPTVLAIHNFMQGFGRTYEILIADDGSTDDTIAILNALNLPHLQTLIAEQNGGKGSAVQRGMLAARGDYVLFTDADNATPIEELETLLPQIETNRYHIAIGSRGAEGATVEGKSFFRHLFSFGLNSLVQTALRLPFKDTQCGFKLFTQAAARRLASAQTLMGFSFDLEILYLARKFGYAVSEVAVNWHDVAGSKVDPIREARRFVRDIAVIRITDIQGGYAPPYAEIPAELDLNGGYAHA